MSNFKQITLLLTFILAASYISNAYAGNLYRYKDENGVTVLGLNIPPHLVGNGYEILSSSGRLIESVAPALTAEQIADRDNKEAEQVRQAMAVKKQKEEDLALLKLYSHPNDAVRVLKRKLQDIDDYISLKNGNISVVKGQLSQEETKAANRERTGKKVPDSTLNKISQQKNKIIEIEQDISVKRAEIPVISKEFDKIITRLESITKKKAKDYPFEEKVPKETSLQTSDIKKEKQ